MKSKLVVYHASHPMNEVLKSLDSASFETHFITVKNQVLDVLKRHKVDLVLLYDMNPEEQELFIDHIHRVAYVPIMVMSKLTNVVHMTHTLNIGADDYVSTLEHIDLIHAKIDALIRRSRYIRKLRFGKIKFQHLTFDLNTYEVRGNGELLPVTNKEFELLILFLSNPNHTLKKEDLFQELWSSSEYYSENVINVHMRHIRKKIELNPDQPQVVETVWGFGYRLGKGTVEYLD